MFFYLSNLQWIRPSHHKSTEVHYRNNITIHSYLYRLTPWFDSGGPESIFVTVCSDLSSFNSYQNRAVIFGHLECHLGHVSLSQTTMHPLGRDKISPQTMSERSHCLVQSLYQMDSFFLLLQPVLEDQKLTCQQCLLSQCIVIYWDVDGDSEVRRSQFWDHFVPGPPQV